MVIKATFIGTHGSLGFRYGKQYRLVVLKVPGNFITVGREDSPKVVCAYESAASFFSNWEDVSAAAHKEPYKVVNFKPPVKP